MSNKERDEELKRLKEISIKSTPDQRIKLAKQAGIIDESNRVNSGFAFPVSRK